MWIRMGLFALLGLAAAAQTDRYFTVGKIGVALGDSEVTVLGNLRSLYQVNKVGAGTYAVGQQQGTEYQKIGTVSFENNRLVSAGSVWQESVDQNSVAFAKRVVEALQHQQLDNPRAATIRTIHRGGDLAAADGVEIVIGDRAIDILTSGAAPGAKPNEGYAAVTETLHEPSYAQSLTQQAGMRTR